MSFPLNGQDCKTIQVIEPDSTLLTATSSGSADPTLDESGEIELPVNELALNVAFATQKASSNYRFEYCYVDSLGLDPDYAIVPTIENQSAAGFTVRFSASAPQTGYILRWRVVVVSFAIGSKIDAPEHIYEQLTASASVHTTQFVNQRSTQDYGFSELRVENLIDLPGQQTPILAQVVAKFTTGFIVALSPTPPNNNYYLVARTP